MAGHEARRSVGAEGTVKSPVSQDTDFEMWHLMWHLAPIRQLSERLE